METMNVVEARKSFSNVIARVAYTGQHVVVETKGRPMMALISIEDLHRLEELERGATPTHAHRVAALALAARTRERIRCERNRTPLPDSADTLDKLREERTHEIASLR